jgi:hypothetical protein
MNQLKISLGLNQYYKSIIKVGNTKNGKPKFWNNLQIKYWWRTQNVTWTTRHQMSSPRKYCWKKDWDLFFKAKKKATKNRI